MPDYNPADLPVLYFIDNTDIVVPLDPRTAVSGIPPSELLATHEVTRFEHGWPVYTVKSK